MGTTDYGTQTLTFDFAEPADSENFNRINYKLHQAGIYEGGLLSYVDSDTVQVSTLVAYMVDSSTGNGIRVSTATTVDVDVSSTNLYIILRFSWANEDANYVDFMAVPYTSVATDDLIIGSVEYADDGTTLLSTFDYTRRDIAKISELSSDTLELTVQSQNPPDNTIYVQGGTIRGVNGEITVSSGSSSAIGDTTLGRYDIIWIDDSGAIQVTEGSDGSSPAASNYSNKFVIAEIQRGASATKVRGSDIVQIRPPNGTSVYGLVDTDGAGFVGFDNSNSANLSSTTVQTAIDEIISDLASTSNGLGASLISIEDASGYFTSTTVEDALIEIIEGNVTLSSVDIDGGTIDGTTIGGNSAGAGTFTNLTATGTINFNGATVSDLGTVTTVDIDGGTIDDVTIGGTTPAAGIFTTLTASDDISLSSGDIDIALNTGSTTALEFNDGATMMQRFDTSNNRVEFYGNNAYIDSSQEIHGAKVWGAVGNDYVDNIDILNDIDIEYGKVYIINNIGEVKLSNNYCQKNILGITSDTPSIIVHKPGSKSLPISIGGFVLAYVDKEYEAGTALTCTSEGKLTIIKEIDKAKYPERIVATYVKNMKDTETWNGVLVENRHLVKIK